MLAKPRRSAWRRRTSQNDASGSQCEPLQRCSGQCEHLQHFQVPFGLGVLLDYIRIADVSRAAIHPDASIRWATGRSTLVAGVPVLRRIETQPHLRNRRSGWANFTGGIRHCDDDDESHRCLPSALHAGHRITVELRVQYNRNSGGAPPPQGATPGFRAKHLWPDDDDRRSEGSSPRPQLAA